MKPAGLVLEGGGMRGIYTAGVLEYFAEQALYFPYVIGVSAGACIAASYLSRQRGRNKTVNIDMVTDPRYLSWGNLWQKRQIFGMDFIFDEIPNSLVPFDYDAFAAAKEEFVVGTTDCRTGKPLYHLKSGDNFDVLKVLRASSSLPFIAPIVEHMGNSLLDGGIADPIPVRQAEVAGYSRNVLVLTRDRNYTKKSNRWSWLLRRAYPQYPELIDTILRRHEVYNETTQYIQEQMKNGLAFVIQPKQPLRVGRMERGQAKLTLAYEEGYEDAKEAYPRLLEWLDNTAGTL